MPGRALLPAPSKEGTTMPSKPPTANAADQAPAADIRIGGFRVTVQRFPVRLLTVLATCGASALTAWFTSR